MLHTSVFCVFVCVFVCVCVCVGNGKIWEDMGEDGGMEENNF